MQLLVLLISSFFLIYSIIIYFKFNYVINTFSLKKVNKLKPNKKVIIVIPCLREQSTIADTIRYFRSINKNDDIVIITTNKELKERKNINESTTQEIIKSDILSKYDNIYWVNYPYEEGYMADQLNYFLKNIKSIGLINDTKQYDDIYIALYNADSRPNKNTFKEIYYYINKDLKVIQQYSYCMKNYNKLSGILKGFSIYQSNFEIKTGIVNGIIQHSLLYTHVVGHGLIINLELLGKLRFFNTDFWCEDVYLGLQLKYKNIKIQPLFSLENIETPDKIEKLIKQNSVWFRTTSQFIKIYKDIKKKNNNVISINGIIGCFNELRCTINWLIFPIIFFLIFLAILLEGHFLLASIYIISYMVYTYVNAYLTIKIINKLDEKYYRIDFKLYIYILIANLISNIGPLYSFFNTKKVKYKTER